MNMASRHRQTARFFIHRVEFITGQQLHLHLLGIELNFLCSLPRRRATGMALKIYRTASIVSSVCIFLIANKYSVYLTTSSYFLVDELESMGILPGLAESLSKPSKMTLLSNSIRGAPSLGKRKASDLSDNAEPPRPSKLQRIITDTIHHPIEEPYFIVGHGTLQ